MNMAGQWPKGLDRRFREAEEVTQIEAPERVPGTRLIAISQGVVADLGGPTLGDMAARTYARDHGVRGFGIPDGALVSYWKEDEPEPPQASWNDLSTLYLDWGLGDEGAQICRVAVYDSEAVKLSQLEFFVLVQNGLSIPVP
jgi:hypothetical protein